jgi:hypothetical protein
MATSCLEVIFQDDEPLYFWMLKHLACDAYRIRPKEYA